MEDRVTPENFSTLERVCDPVSVTVTFGACGIDELVSVIRAAASEAAQGRVGR